MKKALLENEIAGNTYRLIAYMIDPKAGFSKRCSVTKTNEV